MAMSSTEFVSQVVEPFLVELGIEPRKLQADGQLHRYRLVNKPRGDRDGAVVVHLQGVHGICTVWGRNWSTGQEGSRTSKAFKDMTAAEQAAVKAWVEEQRRKAQAAREAQYKKTRNTLAQPLWNKSAPADPAHSYAVKKQMPVEGLRQMQTRKGCILLVPLRDSAGTLWNVQRIFPNGDKRTLPGGRVTGLFFDIPARDGRTDGPLCIAEGWATGLSVHVPTGLAVRVAFNTGNLARVTRDARACFPGRQLVLLEDNDRKNEDTPRNPCNPGVEYCLKAAQETGAWIAHVPAPEGVSRDFSDLYCEEGAGAVCRAIDEALSHVDPRETWASNLAWSNRKKELLISGIQWPEPVWFDEVNVPKFDTARIPSQIGEYCKVTGEELQVPPELCFCIEMPALTTILQRQFIVTDCTGSHAEPLCLFFMCPMEPGNRKSAVVSRCIVPLREWEKKMEKDMQTAIREATVRRRSIEKRISALENKQAKTDNDQEWEDIQQQILKLEEEKPEIPKAPRLLVQNITPEALGVRLRENGGCLGLLADEGGVFDIFAGQYNGGIPNLDLLLKAHDGTFFSCDRIGRDNDTVDQPMLSVGISPQPITLSDRKAAKAFRARGLDGRFLYVLPKSPVGQRKYRTCVNSEETVRRHNELFKRLLPSSCENWSETPQLQPLKLSKEADSIYEELFYKIEQELNPGGDFEDMKDWATKLHGRILRIAGVFHVVQNDNPASLEISEATMKQAAYVGFYLVEHAKAAYGVMGEDEDIERAKYVLEWIQRKELRKFSFRTCQQDLHSRVMFRKSAAIESALETLIERDFIRKMSVQATPGPGRTAKPEFAVNPYALRKVKQ